MAIIFNDTFAGSGSIGGHNPDTPFGSQLWVDNDSTNLSGGFAVSGYVGSTADNISTAIYGDSGGGGYGLGEDLTITFDHVSPASVGTGSPEAKGFRHVFSVSGMDIYVQLDVFSAAWRLQLITSPGGVIDSATVTVAPSTTYSGELTITDGSMTLVMFGQTLTVADTFPSTGGLKQLILGVGAKSQMGFLTVAETVILGGVIDLTMPMPTVLANSGDTYALPNMPMPQLEFGLGAGQLFLEMPMPQLAFRIIEGVLGTIDAVMPLPTLEMRLGNEVEATLPMPVLDFAITTVGLISIDAELPMPTLDMAIDKTESIGVDITMPMPTLIGYGGTLIEATINGFTLEAQVTTGSEISIQAELPLFELSMAISSGNTISIDGELPMMEPGPYGRIQLVMPMGELTLIGTAVVAVTYEAYAVNLNHKGVKEPVDEVTRYTNFPFERIVRYNNSYFGVAADGLYLLEGTTDHATPAIQIPWEFKTHMTDFENPKEKTIVSAYFGGRLGKAETITLYAGEKAEKAYKYKTARGSTAQNHREKFGRGIKARYFAIGANGADGMELDNIEFNIHTLTRRI